VTTKSNLEKRKNPPFGKFPISSRVPASRTSYAQMVVYHYTKQNFGIGSTLREPFPDNVSFNVEVIQLEAEIASMKTSKSLSQTSGTFDVMLFPSRNWKQKIFPGDWVALYLYNKIESTSDTKNKSKPTHKNLIMLGNVDRVARALDRDEDDKMELRYQVSGRNFGKVFEDTDIWFDPYQNQENTLDVQLRTGGLHLVGNPSSLCNSIVDLFLGPGASLPEGRTSSLGQFQIPGELAQLFKKGGGRAIGGKTLFYDILENVIEPNLPGFKARAMVSLDSNDNVWGYLQRNSNEAINELFLEEIRSNDGTATPSLILRARPFQTPFFDSQFGTDRNLSKYKPLLNNTQKSFQEFSKESFVEISPAEVYSENLGRDDHTRFNMFWLSSTRFSEYVQNMFANKNFSGGISNAFKIGESIKRHGLQRMQRMLEFDLPTEGRGGTSEIELFAAMMIQLYDQNYVNHLYESGTIQTSGVLEAELGKVLTMLPDSGSGNLPKIYYIEGYEHTWTFPNTWRTIFTVSKGQFQTNDQNIFIDVVNSGPGFKDFGRLDKGFDSAYVAKTNSRNK